MSEKEILKNFVYLGEGAGRRVFAISKEFVIKIAKGKFGIMQNKIEGFVYRNASSKYNKYLCPVVWYKPSMLVMRRAVPLVEDTEYFTSLKDFCRNEIFYRDIQVLTRKYLLSSKDIRAKSSWGTLDGKYVLIDYGCPSKKGYWHYNILKR